MTTNEFICVCLGIGTASSKIDEICDKFDLDITDDDVWRTLDLFRGNYTGFGNCLISDLYQQVIDYWVEQGLDKEKFDYYTNGDDSHLYYDKEQVFSNNDLQEILDNLENEEEEE